MLGAHPVGYIRSMTNPRTPGDGCARCSDSGERRHARRGLRQPGVRPPPRGRIAPPVRPAMNVYCARYEPSDSSRPGASSSTAMDLSEIGQSPNWRRGPGTRARRHRRSGQRQGDPSDASIPPPLRRSTLAEVVDWSRNDHPAIATSASAAGRPRTTRPGIGAGAALLHRAQREAPDLQPAARSRSFTSKFLRVVPFSGQRSRGQPSRGALTGNQRSKIAA